MEHRGVTLLQLKMFLLLVRTLPITLLLSLVVGHVTTTTKETGITCRQKIPATLIRELWSRTKILINRLPRENSFRRLLPKFCVKCAGHAIGWLEIQELIDVYQRTVFSRESVHKLLPLHYSDLLHRLQHSLHHCVPSSKLTKPLQLIKNLERKIKKRRRDDRALKAVREFTFILRWIDELAYRHIL